MDKRPFFGQIAETGQKVVQRCTLFDSIDQLLGGGFLHLDVGKEFLPGILQAGPEEIDNIVDDEESVVIMLGGTDI